MIDGLFSTQIIPTSSHTGRVEKLIAGNKPTFKIAAIENEILAPLCYLARGPAAEEEGFGCRTTEKGFG